MFLKSAIFIVIINIYLVDSLMRQCPDFQVHFEKILGYRPSLPGSLYNVKILHKSYNIIPSVINLHCMDLCKNDHNCDGYVLNFNKSECYGFSSNEQEFENLNFRRADESELVEDHQVVYFIKTCLSVPVKCKSLWPILRIPGASLINRGYLTVNKLITRSQCIAQCLFETSFKCRSVSFQISQRNNQVRMGLANILNKNVIGRCILSRDDKNLEPDSFRTAQLSDEYIENNCLLAIDEENEQFFDDLCSYEHFPGTALLYAEQMYIGLSDRECQEKCFKENKFFCKGITFHRIQGTADTRCFIHSEDFLSIGSRALIAMPDSYYMKRVQCLNLSVRCTNTDMIIRYSPRNYFQGRIYTENHPDSCSSTASTHGPTFLMLSIGSPISEQRCGLNRAFDFESPNRTLIYVYIIIQQNPLVQMMGDRFLKVGCIIHLNRIHSPDIPDMSLETSMAFNGKDYAGYGTLVVEDREFKCPKLNIFIVDPFTEELVKEARIGQALKFIISMESHYENYDLRVINLTANSDYEMLELINLFGCPINPSIFPPLQSEKTENSRRLIATFKAFKFATSPQIKLRAVIQFCNGNCISSRSCGYGRKKRDNSAGIVNKSPSLPLDKIIFPDEVLSTAKPLEPVKFPEPPQKLVGLRTDSFGYPKGIQNYYGNDYDDVTQSKVVTVPLDITLNVLEPDNDGDRFIVGDSHSDHIIVGSLATSKSSLCLDESMIIAILIFWLIFQVIIILGCCVMMQKYRKMTSFDDTSSFNNSDSLENRHVRWADQRSIHDTYFQ